MGKIRFKRNQVPCASLRNIPAAKSLIATRNLVRGTKNCCVPGRLGLARSHVLDHPLDGLDGGAPHLRSHSAAVALEALLSFLSSPPPPPPVISFCDNSQSDSVRPSGSESVFRKQQLFAVPFADYMWRRREGEEGHACESARDRERIVLNRHESSRSVCETGSFG